MNQNVHNSRRAKCKDLAQASAPAITLREIFGPRGCNGTLAAGSRAAFVLTLLESIIIAVHFQGVHLVGEPVQQGTGRPLRAQHLGPFLKWQVAGR